MATTTSGMSNFNGADAPSQASVLGSGPVSGLGQGVSGREERHARPRLLPRAVTNPVASAAGAAGVVSSPTRDRFVAALRAAGVLTRLDRYLSEVRDARIDQTTLEIVVSSRFVADLLQRRSGDACVLAAREILGAGAEVRVVVDPATARVSLPDAPDTPARVDVVRPARMPTPRPARHRLDEFVVGASNRLAHSAAVRLAEGQNADSLSPLFFHAPCGMGKTHLLQGIAARFMELNPSVGVRCLTAEGFTNEFIAALKAGGIEAFRRSYRRLGLLCIDDVHFLSSKDATQTELLHTLDAIAQGGAKIVLASDEHPREIRKLSSALSSRFMSGAVLRIEEPDEALRRALADRLSAKRGIALDPGGVQALAGAAWRSVRELEGVLTQILAAVRLLPELAMATALSATHVRRALEMAGGVKPPAPVGGSSRSRRPVPIALIQSEVARALCVDLGEMAGTGRHRRVVLARSIVVYLARRLTTLSFPEIARAMGRPNHSSVITAHNRLIGLLTDAENADAGGAETEELALTHADLRAIGLSTGLMDFCRGLERTAIERAESI